MTMTGSAWAIGQRVLDDFVVQRELGAGGMGTVYLLSSRSSGRLFAVKKAQSADATSRGLFLAELWTWIDLPAHPHLVACHFFRTIADEIAIFAEYVAGGSLDDCIRQNRLHSLEQILDIAIESAWGLHALHELGLVHRDVKPGNILLSPEGLARISDFGVAQARAAAQRAGGGSQSVLMTPAFCSPEQAEGRPLDRRTDIWSWGLSVLAAFTGGANWITGLAARDILQSYREAGPPEPGLPRMPAPLAAILQRCFAEDPAQRWPSLDAAARAIIDFWPQVIGKSYTRQPPPVPRPQRTVPLSFRSAHIRGGTEEDLSPQVLDLVLQAAGEDAEQIKAALPPRMGSRKAQVVAVLAAYEEIWTIVQRLARAGRFRDPEFVLALLCTNKAGAHMDAQDATGALALLERAIASYESLVRQQGRSELTEQLALAYFNKAGVLLALGQSRAAATLYEQAASLYELLVHEQGRHDLTNALGRACEEQAAALSNIGQGRAALPLLDRALSLRQRLVDQGGGDVMRAELARACFLKARVLGHLAQYPDCVSTYDRAISLYEQLPAASAQADLAAARMYKAAAVHALGNHPAALVLYDQAIAALEDLVEQGTSREALEDLARAYGSKAEVVRSLGNHRTAIGLLEQAIVILSRLVEQEGQREKAHDLAAALLNKALLVSELTGNRAGVALYDPPIRLYQGLVAQQQRAELRPHLALALMSKARAAYAVGDARSALDLHERAGTLYQALVVEGHADLAPALADSWALRAVALLKLGDPAAARIWVERALELYRKIVDDQGRDDLAGKLARLRELAAIIGSQSPPP